VYTRASSNEEKSLKRLSRGVGTGETVLDDPLGVSGPALLGAQNNEMLKGTGSKSVADKSSNTLQTTSHTLFMLDPELHTTCSSGGS